MPYGSINGVQIFYRTKGKGTPIIFIHPPLLTSANFTYQLEQLSDRFQIILFDIRGHGKSEVSEVPLTYTLIAEDIKQLMNVLDIDKAFLCGYSTGGGIALEAMLSYPDRFYGSILISAMSEVSDRWLRTKLITAITLSTIKAKKMLSAAIAWGNADMAQTYRNLFQGATAGAINNIRQYFYNSLVYNCTHQLKQIHVPQLLLYGEKDRHFKRYARMLHTELPNSTLIFMKKVHHQIPTKAATQMNRILSSWISQQIESDDQSDHGWTAMLNNQEAYLMDEADMIQ